MNFTIRASGENHPGQPTGRLALVCEGGGQRGIFTAGVLDTFMERDYFPFQLLIGTSAGAQNLAAYACGAHGYARHIIVRYTTSKTFFNPLRFARGGHLIDLDWLFETSNRDIPLDLQQGRHRLAGRDLYLCASRSDSLRADYLRFDIDDWDQTVKASSAIPLFYRGGVSVNGVNYWDGGVADALPVVAAHEYGGDCIVVIRTLPASHAVKPLKLPQSLTRGRFTNMAALLTTHMDGYLRAQTFIDAPPAGVKVIELAPRLPLKSMLLGSRPEALRHDYRQGRLCAQQFLARHGWRLQRRYAG